MPDVLHPKKFPFAATMLAAAIGAFVLMQATERRSVALSADTGHAGDDHARGNQRDPVGEDLVEDAPEHVAKAAERDSLGHAGAAAM
ncbi:hypothetical protein ACC771_08725, partial [Rhizobium ruizarguesonis]